MRFGSARVARFVLIVAAAFAISGAAASAAFAQSYTAVVTPGSVAGLSSTTFNVALTNTSENTPLASAIIRPPSKFTLTSASLDDQNGNITVEPTRVVLTDLGLEPGQTVNVAVTATAGSVCRTPYRWTTKAFPNGLFQQQLSLNSDASSLSTAVTCSAAKRLKFATAPTNTLVNQDITPAVTVQLIGAGGNPVSESGVPVTLALGNNPGLGTLGGTLVELTDESGLATFDDLSINLPGRGYTLTASSPTLGGVTSRPFNESNRTTTTCTTSPCTTDLGTSDSNLEISADAAAGTITESVDVGSPLSCAAAANGGYTGFDTHWFQFLETGTVQKTLSYELFGLTSDQIGSVQMCFGAPYEFTTNNGTQAAAGTLPDGSRGFVGLLPGCGAVVDLPCIQSIAPFTDDTSGLLVTVIVPGTLVNDAPADPSMHG